MVMKLLLLKDGGALYLALRSSVQTNSEFMSSPASRAEINPESEMGFK